MPGIVDEVEVEERGGKEEEEELGEGKEEEEDVVWYGIV